MTIINTESLNSVTQIISERGYIDIFKPEGALWRNPLAFSENFSIKAFGKCPLPGCWCQWDWRYHCFTWNVEFSQKLVN